MRFFDQHPALIPSLFFLLGMSLALNPDISLCIPLAALICCRIGSKRLITGLIFFSIAFFHGKVSQEKFPEETSSIEGLALFLPNAIQEQQIHNKKIYKVKGTIRSMRENQIEIASNITCSVTIPKSILSELSNKYLIQGCLEKKENYFHFTPNPLVPWTRLDDSFSLVKWRFKAKKFLSKAIKGSYSNKKVSELLIALTLGDLQDRHLRFSFGKLGLQHILAISGFHFGLLTVFLGFFLRIFLKQRYAMITLGLVLSMYFLLLGNSPSILRAYLATLLIIFANLFQRRYTALNIFSLTLLLELILSPKSIHSLGFHLSFLATGSILMLSPLTLTYTEKFLPTRRAQQTANLSFLEKFVYKLVKFIKETVSVNLAVHLTILPTCLFYFGQFPLSCFLYNLFIPVAISLSLFLFLAAIPFFFLIPFLSSFIHSCNELFTQQILRIIIEAPNILNKQIFYPNMPKWLLFSILVAAFFLSSNHNLLQSKKPELSS